MSVLRLYAVRDSAVGAYMRPWVARSDGEALRSFVQEANNPESAISRNPEDFGLFFVGEFDDETGQIVAPTAAHHMGLAAHYLRKVEVMP